MQVKGIDKMDTIIYNETNRKASNTINAKAEHTDNKSDGVCEKERANDKERTYTEDELIRSIESANEEFIIYDRKLEFSIHEQTKQIMVKVIDVSTDEVIREIPPEKILDAVAFRWKAAGILVDERI